MAKRTPKTSNEDAALIIEAVKKTHAICDKKAMSAIVGKYIYTSDGTATAYVPIPSLEIHNGFSADLLAKALEGTTEAFSITDTDNSILVRSGKRRAKLPTVSLSGMNIRATDAMTGCVVAPDFVLKIAEYIGGMPRKLINANDAGSQVVLLADDGYIYWTNRVTAMRLFVGMWFPNSYVYIKDLMQLSKYGGDVVSYGGSAYTLTFTMQDGGMIQLVTVRDSDLKYPAERLRSMFNIDLTLPTYPVGAEFIDALHYVAKMNDAPSSVVFVSDKHIGNTPDPQGGTYVEIDGLSITRAFNSQHLILVLEHDVHELRLPDASSAIAAILSNDTAMWFIAGVRV